MISTSAFINLETARALVVDDNSSSLEIIASILTSFGLKDVTRIEHANDAVALLRHETFDLILTDAQMPDLDGYDLVHWLRRNGGDTSRVTPVLIVTGHTRRADILRARDCGANFIIAKPVSPRVLMERIFWVARGDRMFVESSRYVGPDRRFKNEGPPVEHGDGRRMGDVPFELGEPIAPNLSQHDLDNLVKPQRAAS